MIKDVSGIIELDAQFHNCALLRVYDNAGVEYANATKSGSFVMFNTNKLPSKGVYVTAVMTETILQTRKSVSLFSIGNCWYRVEGLRVSRTKTDGLYHTAPCDIENIKGIHDENRTEFFCKRNTARLCVHSANYQNNY